MRQEIRCLQKEMKKQNISMYLVPTSDEHQSEYIPEAYKFRAYLSGFTGSAGTLLVTKDECLLWTDGRYHIQAEKQLENSGIILMKSGEDDVMTVEEYISSHIQEQEVVGLNGTLFSMAYMNQLRSVLKQAKASFYDVDLSVEVWKERPALLVGKIKDFPIHYTGMSRMEKIEWIRRKMEESDADMHIISSLDDIAWTFNLRGSDIPYNPVFFSYAIISKQDVKLFVKSHALHKNLRTELNDEKIQVLDYFDFYQYIEKFCKDRKILLDPYKTNDRTYCLLVEKNEIIAAMNPSVERKAIKTKNEIKHIRYAHELDGLVMTRFIYWIKKQIKAGCVLTEYEAAEYLDALRLQQEACMDLSFDTIAAYNENAAMCHYSPSKEQSAVIKPEGFLLVDSGGQYLEGTTDVTRTIAVGPLTDIQKEHYTLVLQGHIRLAMARFPKGICGANLDILARGPLWNKGLDYNHGTGHGVGYYLNVHEGPNNFHWNLQRSKKAIPLQTGMLTSDEPGLYLEGQYGIRIENLILTKESKVNDHAGFMEFETVTMVPYEKDAIVSDMLSIEEKTWLNQYNHRLFELYKDQLLPEEARWLSEVTEPL